MIAEQFARTPEATALLFATKTTIESEAHKKALVARSFPAERIVGQACHKLAGAIERGTASEETVGYIRLFVGEAFDVVADRTQTDWRAISPRESESGYSISIRNRKDEDVVVTVREPVGGDWTLVSSSIPGTKRDAGTLEFAVPVPKGKETRLAYRIRTRW